MRSPLRTQFTSPSEACFTNRPQLEDLDCGGSSVTSAAATLRLLYSLN
ncbi:hypothetical protein ACFRIB_51525 [Streptomyces mirabilis]